VTYRAYRAYRALFSRNFAGHLGELVRIVRLVRTKLQRTTRPEGRSGPRVAHISLVFREIWDTTDLNCSPRRVRKVLGGRNCPYGVCAQAKAGGNRTGAPCSPQRTWAEKDGRSPTIAFAIRPRREVPAVKHNSQALTKLPVTWFSPLTAKCVNLRSKGRIRAAAFETITNAIEIEINDRSGVEGKHLAEEQTAGDSNTERPA
jgi:hypothetical protein